MSHARRLPRALADARREAPRLRPAVSLPVLAGSLALAMCPLAEIPGQQEQPLVYPEARREGQVDDYHGTLVPDPYRWLEDPDSDETRAWVEAQNRLTFGWLEQVAPRRWLRERLEQVWNYERYGLPVARRGRYFFLRNDGLQNQSVLYWSDGLEGKPQALLDPNQLSPDGTVALTGVVPSDDGTLVAYGLARAGSDWQEWRVRDVATGKDLDDLLQWVKFSSASWTPDGAGFYYSRYDEPPPGQELVAANYYHKLYYHRLGTPQSEDRLVYHRPDQKEWGFDADVTDDGRYLVIGVWRSTEEKHQLFYVDLHDPRQQVVELITGFDAAYSFVGNVGERFFVLTDLDAPRYRLVAIDLARPQREAWQTIIPEQPDVLQQVTHVGGRLFAVLLHDAHSLVQMYSTEGEPMGELPLPDLGSVAGLGGRADDTETFYSFTNFSTPATIYRYDLTTGRSEVFRQPQVPFNPADYETHQVFCTSRDGTRVPLFLVHSKHLPKDGRAPTLLYGYGGFNQSLTPAFSPARIVWLELGGILAVANLRGGGEYGREWHEAGMKEKKQNVFDDFLAAAEYLQQAGYTRRERLAIQGGSNGGLLVAAAMTQRPDLFGAVICQVGVLDMLRYHKFTIGWAWVGEYGSADDPEQFAYLYRYSPLHNLRPGTSYPATLIMTADHDDRVVPAHSFKFAAALQRAQAGPAPILIRIAESAGHGAGKPTAKLLDEQADIYAFLLRTLGVDVPPSAAAK
jgi:prolyl oligopeptidase